MHDPQELRGLARKCRILMNTSLKPCVNKQLWLWADELVDYADKVERHAKHEASDRAGRGKRELAS
jgi:hypothetical protein